MLVGWEESQAFSRQVLLSKYLSMIMLIIIRFGLSHLKRLYIYVTHLEAYIFWFEFYVDYVGNVYRAYHLC